jgi:hypothetical protein
MTRFSILLLLLCAACGPQRACAASPTPPATETAPPIIVPSEPAPAAPIVHEEPAPGLEPAQVLIVPARVAQPKRVVRRAEKPPIECVAFPGEEDMVMCSDGLLYPTMTMRNLAAIGSDPYCVGWAILPSGHVYCTRTSAPVPADSRWRTNIAAERAAGIPQLCPAGELWSPRDPAKGTKVCCTNTDEWATITGYPRCVNSRLPAGGDFVQCVYGFVGRTSSCKEP